MLLLAGRAIKGGAPGLHDALDPALAAAGDAGLAFAVVDPEIVLESAEFAVRALMVAQRRPAGLDRIFRAAGAGARIACVTSAGPIGVAIGLAFGVPEERMIRTSAVIRDASITELRFRSQEFDWRPDQLSMVTFNVTAHLRAELHTER